MLIDSHCHIPLILEQTPPELRAARLHELLAQAAEAGVSHLLCVAVELDSLPALLGLARAYPHITASCGVHPNYLVKHEPDEHSLAGHARDARIIAIGETGLDTYRSHGDLQWQRERFRRHIRVARLLKKPLIIHSREAAAETLQILREEKAHEVGGIMHCFSYDYDTAIKALDENFVISFSGIITFKTAQSLQEAARKLPLDQILVETDSPYLAPVPFRGKQNHPALVRHVAEFIAQLRGVSFADIACATTANFHRLFPTAIAA